jgi:gliding motility-associated-like protein
LSVQPETGRTVLYWSKSPSPDVAGYVVYYYRNGEGFAFDTIHNPLADSYVNLGSSSSFRSESYVIAAFDSSANISPLSNVLSTMYVEPQIDTCKKTIQITWNKYNPSPKKVNSYRIFISENGGTLYEAGVTDSSLNTFTVNDFIPDNQYCFEIEASLVGGYSSFSNRTSCLFARMQRPPQWINADYATVNESGNISLSFTIDPLSEINLFSLERMRDSESNFTQITQIEATDGKISYTDKTADPGQKNYYKLTAVNNCGLPVSASNLAVNLVLIAHREDDAISLTWNSYRYWIGGVSCYRVFFDTGKGFTEKTLINCTDTTLQINYRDIMYDVTGNKICFYITATETTNLHNITGESRSQQVCTETTERITVPTAFTPDNNLVNDLFRPVLSFTPVEYHLVITDRQNNILFESTDSQAQWDGTKNGSRLPEGVYLWFMTVKTPSGKTIKKSGTVALIRNR